MPTSLEVLAHPRRGSFCHALADGAQNAIEDLGHDVARHDLYAEDSNRSCSALAH